MYRTRRTRLVWGSGARKRRFLNFRTSLSAWWNRYYEDGGDGLEAARHVHIARQLSFKFLGEPSEVFPLPLYGCKSRPCGCPG